MLRRELRDLQLIFGGYLQASILAANSLALLRHGWACEKSYQVLCQMNGMIGNLLQTTRGKDNVQIVLVSDYRLLPAGLQGKRTQNIVTISIY